MAVELDDAWLQAVCAVCDPVFESANVGFVRQVQTDRSGRPDALLWEADPDQFASRYPDTGVTPERYCDQWSNLHCVDFWVYLEGGWARLSLEPWPFEDETWRLTGDGSTDGKAIAAVMARLLRVNPPAA